MNHNRQSVIEFYAGYTICFVLIVLMIWPFLSSIIFAAILAGTFRPVQMWIEKRIGSPKWSAILVCLIILTALFLPSVLLIFKLSEEALLLYQSLKTHFGTLEFEQLFLGNHYVPETIRNLFHTLDLEFNFNSVRGVLLDASKDISATVLQVINSWITNIFSFLFQFLLMLIVVFTLLVDGDRIKSFFLALSPLPDEEEELVIDRFNQVNSVTLVGNGVGALIQGLLAAIGLWLVGIESLVLWTTIMIIMAFIPLVGISVIYVPVTLYLLISGKVLWAILFFAYCTIVSLAVENWFKPRFVGNRADLNSTAVFFSIIGGMTVFGLPGIFYGPLIISIFLTFTDLYHKRYAAAAHDDVDTISSSSNI